MKPLGGVAYMALAMLVSAETSAEPQRFAMDTSHSRIVFSIG